MTDNNHLDSITFDYDTPIEEVSEWMKLLLEWADKNECSGFPKDLESLLRLEELRMETKDVDTLVDYINNESLELSENIQYLQNLKILDLSWSHIKKLPNEIKILNNLKVLKLSWMELDEIPDVIFDLTNLEELYLGYTRYHEPLEEYELGPIGYRETTEPYSSDISYISSSLGKLINLRNLQIEGVSIGSIPKTIENLGKLETINLFNCNLTRIPSGIGLFNNLKILDLGDNFLSELPESIVNLSNLTKLSIGGNPNLYLTKEQKEWIIKLEKGGCDVQYDDNLFHEIVLGELNPKSSVNRSTFSHRYQGRIVGKNIKCRIHKTIWERHKAGRYDSTRATCSICNNSTFSYGSGDGSVKRCLVLLKNSCPIGSNHFYVADVVEEHRKYKGNTSTQIYKDGEEFLESDEGRLNENPLKNNSVTYSESEIIYVRAVDNDNNYSRSFVVHRCANHPVLPEKFVLSVFENAFENGDIVRNTELNLYSEYRLGILNNILEGFRRPLEIGYCIIVEVTTDTYGLLRPTKEKDLSNNNDRQSRIETCDKTQKTVIYLNQCINKYSNQVEWLKILYSLAGWAEYFATNEYDTVVEEYAPQLIEKLEILKEYVDSGRMLLETDIDFLINKYSLEIDGSKLHLKIEPYL